MTKRLIIYAVLLFSLASFAEALDLSGSTTYLPREMDPVFWSAPPVVYDPDSAANDENYLRYESYAVLELDNSRGELQSILMEFVFNLELVELGLISPGGELVELQTTGDIIPVARRRVPSMRSVVPLTLTEKGIYTLQFHFKNSQSIHGQVRFYQPPQFHLQAAGRQALLIFFFSIILIVAGLNCVFSIILRNRDHLYYALLMLCLMIALMGKHRILSFLLFPDRHYGYFVYIFFNSLCLAASLQFCIGFFRIPFKSRLAAALRILSILFVLYALVSVFVATPAMGDWMNALILPTIAVILALVFRSGLKGDKPSRFILLSTIPILLSVIADNLYIYIDGFPGGESHFFQLGGTVVHIIIFNYGLVMRQIEKNRAYDRLVADFNSNVEEHVSLRTKELEHSVYHDELSGLLNRKGLEKALADFSAQQIGSMGIIFTDLDNFKYFNDSYGHLTGDLIIQEIAGFLKSSARNSDRVIRYGGDEFVILLPSMNEEGTVWFARRLLEAFRDFSNRISRNLNVEDVLLGLSVGAGQWHEEGGVSMRSVLHEADKAMYKAKKQRKSGRPEAFLRNRGAIVFAETS